MRWSLLELSASSYMRRSQVWRVSSGQRGSLRSRDVEVVGFTHSFTNNSQSYLIFCACEQNVYETLSPAEMETTDVTFKTDLLIVNDAERWNNFWLQL